MAENPARLTSHDWLDTDSTLPPERVLPPWNQAQIREGMSGRDVNGYWNVNVVEDGEYEIRLRRWPEESGAALDAGLKPGADVPGTRTFRARPGRALPIVKASVAIAGQKAESPVKPGDQDAVFRMTLKAGTTTLTTRFVTSEGEVLGAYYVSVRKL